MKSTSYGTGALCSSWCCHFKSCDVHLSICSVLFPATSPSSLPAPHCCQTKPWVPAQVPGSGSRFPLIRTHRGKKKIPIFFLTQFPSPGYCRGPQPMWCAMGQWCESRGSGFAVGRQGCSNTWVSELVLFCHPCTQFFTGISNQMNKAKGTKTCTWMWQF